MSLSVLIARHTELSEAGIVILDTSMGGFRDKRGRCHIQLADQARVLKKQKCHLILSASLEDRESPRRSCATPLHSPPTSPVFLE